MLSAFTWTDSANAQVGSLHSHDQFQSLLSACTCTHKPTAHFCSEMPTDHLFSKCTLSRPLPLPMCALCMYLQSQAHCETLLSVFTFTHMTTVPLWLLHNQCSHANDCLARTGICTKQVSHPYLIVVLSCVLIHAGLLGTCTHMPTAHHVSCVVSCTHITQQPSDLCRTYTDMLTAPLCSLQVLGLTLPSSGLSGELQSHVHFLSLAFVGTCSHSHPHTGDICRHLQSFPLHCLSSEETCPTGSSLSSEGKCTHMCKDTFWPLQAPALKGPLTLCGPYKYMQLHADGPSLSLDCTCIHTALPHSELCRHMSAYVVLFYSMNTPALTSPQSHRLCRHIHSHTH